jgi:hypothetical protein
VRLNLSNLLFYFDSLTLLLRCLDASPDRGVPFNSDFQSLRSPLRGRCSYRYGEPGWAQFWAQSRKSKNPSPRTQKWL